ncbi:hypothetical protein PF002_g19598 [Phytophthora fragariae]|uniref:Uncharacterized protein n=2 Tax=Phytophthora TaxID=4783 RepID=A0A6A3E8M5_9STRA|nr:hypothetical protein PF003_g16220 [Phytophthora fragariae]KAE9332295.1 hypothetical protein PR003_g14582 [Phytophthora rubi]KAE8930169.1 hypothetical protein PF009_g19731 [Phytophthora fragariae]KAE9099454.1 hypothetical protein PF007_g15874 [Phytophthora fragariae]KAE9189471.1 hypothetical protein PF004_g22208 [Phytophthora fragariae]
MKEYEWLEKKDMATERALKVNTGRSQGGKGNGHKWNGSR